MHILAPGARSPHTLAAPRPRTEALKEESTSTDQESFADRFSSSWGERAFGAVGYSAGAGTIAGLAVATVLPVAGLAHLGMAGAVGAAVGAGFGLLAATAASAVTALASDPKAPDQPNPPVRREPPLSAEPVQPHPDLRADREMEKAKSILDRRASLVEGYVDAFLTVKDSFGRLGRDTVRTTGDQVAKAEQEWQQHQAARAQTQRLERQEVRQKAETRLEELKSLRTSLVATQVQADGIVKDSLGRLGREGGDAVKRLAGDTDAEIARLEQALKTD